jgi:uncharacterized protein YcfJ
LDEPALFPATTKITPMPESHHRHKPKHHHQPQTKHHGSRKKMTAAVFMAAIGGLFGMSFGYFTGDRSWTWTVVGTIIGIAVGNLFGRAIDKSTGAKK